MTPSSVAGLVILALASACGGSSHDAPHDAGTDAAGPLFTQLQVPVTPPTQLDLLFVIDNSPSMAAKQANFASRFSTLIDGLSGLPGGLPDLHIGVVTTDLGTQGALDATPGPTIGTIGQGGCAKAGDAGALRTGGAPITTTRYITDAPGPGGTRVTNYPAAMTLSDVFTVMAKAGEGGCAFEQPLEAMKQALLPTTTLNQGFLRPAAALGVVFLTDEDDCSLAHSTLLAANADATLGPLQSFRCTQFGITCDTGGATTADMSTVGTKDGCHPTADATYLTSVGDYAAFLQSRKVDPALVAAAAIMGAPAPFAVELRPVAGVPSPALAHSCSYLDDLGVSQTADPPIRLATFLADLAPGHGGASPLCTLDLTPELADIAVPLRTAMGDPCFHMRLLDTDATTARVQPDCTVTVDGGMTLPRCTPDDGTATNPPCYRIVQDGVACGRSVTNGSARLELEGADQLSATAHVTAKCKRDPGA